MEIFRTRNATAMILFPIIDADGDTVTGAAGLDSEFTIWSDTGEPAAFADCTNEAVEVGATGIYRLGVVAGELNNDYTYIQVKTTTTGAKTQHILIRTRLATNSITSSALDDSATGEITAAVWATGAKAITSVGSGGITAASFAAGAIDAASIAADAITSSELAQSAAQEVADEVLNRDLAGGASGGARVVRDALRVLRNRVTLATNTRTLTVYQENDSTTAWTAVVSTNSGTQFIVEVDP